jgi:hypothetical protein
MPKKWCTKTHGKKCAKCELTNAQSPENGIGHKCVTNQYVVINMKTLARQIFDYTIALLNSHDFLCEHRLSPKFFSRIPKKLSFKNIILMTLNLIKKAITAEIMNFF